MRLRSPIVVPGGKFYTTAYICKIIPPHRIYVEPFGGAAQLLFAKPKSKIEVYNDIHSGLVNFFRVFRDENKFWKLLNLLQLTPYSREEFYFCRDNWKTEKDDVEKARQWFVVCRQSLYAIADGTWFFTKKKSAGQVGFRGILDIFPLLRERFKDVYIEHLDAIECMKKWDSKDTFFYLDPPYPFIEMGKKRRILYENEMSIEEHKNLLQFIQTLKGKVIISSYSNSLYDDILIKNGWKKENIIIKNRFFFNSKTARHRGHREEALYIKV